VFWRDIPFESVHCFSVVGLRTFAKHEPLPWSVFPLRPLGDLGPSFPVLELEIPIYQPVLDCRVLMRSVMSREHELTLNLSDAKVWAAIRYLDPDTNDPADQEQPELFVVYASILMFVLGYMGLVWLCRRIA
jgi:hypothetical protein